MTYAIKSDLETRFSVDEILQLADRDGSGVVDTGVIEAALLDAVEEINGYLSGRYTLPLASVPALITRLACDISRYRLWKDRASEHVRKNYEDAVDTLKRIASGIINIPLTTGLEPTGPGVIVVTARAQAFTADVLDMMP